MRASVPAPPPSSTRPRLEPSAAATLVGRSPALARVLEHVRRVAATPRTTVLVLGESGVGKELVARAVHERSARAHRPFVAVNCASLTETLLEAELFGYEPGAFTGAAAKGRDGLLAAAEGGTLLLDEIGEMDLALQARLLRVLQESTYRRVGGTVDRPMDVRIIASTNRDPEELVEEGRFREDLFYRLNVLSLRVPPLRERPEDVVPLAVHFLRQLAVELGRELDGFSEAALARLAAHAWPGNVRELRNAVERAALLAAGTRVEAEDLPSLGGGARRTAARVASADDADALRLPLGDCSLRAMEEALIRQVLARSEGNRSRAARMLGVNRTTLYAKLERYGIRA